MHFLVFNYPGIAITAIGFGLAYGIGWFFGDTREDVLMVLASPSLIIGNLAYRNWRTGGHWLHPGRGGMLLFLPVWCLGLLWLGIGAYRLAMPEKTAGVAKPPAVVQPAVKVQPAPLGGR